jgi:MFS family permease
VGSLNIVAAFGGLVAGKAADVFGRRPTIALACVVFIAGAAIMSISEGFWLLLVGRIITGVGVGCAMVSACLVQLKSLFVQFES